MAKQQPVKSRARADLPFTPPVWPATNPEMRRIADIHEYPKNPRKHPPDQIAMLARLMKQHGVDQPIVVDEAGVILKGHGRRLAALAAGFEEFPVVVHRGLSEVDKTAMRIQDNQVSILAGWDTQLMGGAIAELRSSGYEVALLGFPESQLRSFGPGIGDPQPDVVPIPPKAPIVRVGDLWVLGKHRVLCGDSTRVENWKKLFGQERASLIFTDPPYGVSYQAQSGAFGVIEGDKKRRDELYKMLLKAIGNLVDHAHDKAAFYIWHASETREDFAQAMKAAGLAERQYILWVKPAIVLGHADYQWQHEPCFYAAKAGASPAFYADRGESTVWHVQTTASKDTAATIGNGIVLLDGEGRTMFIQARTPKNKKLRQIRVPKDGHVYLSGADRQDSTVWEVARDGNHEHPTQKPVELARRAIENSSQAGEIVADGFMGSGGTLVGCEMTARRCYGMELDPVYAEVIVRRWERLTGQKASLDGRTLEQVAKGAQGRRAEAMKRVILESPFAGHGPWPLNVLRRWRNRRYARACVRDSLCRGEAPIASHLLYTQPGVLRDGDATERARGIEAGLAWGAVADATVVYLDRVVSAGMGQGIERALREGRVVQYRWLGSAPNETGRPKQPAPSRKRTVGQPGA